MRQTISCQIKDLGIIDYALAWKIQKEQVLKVIQGEPAALFFCEHPPVLTLGRLAKEEYILLPVDDLKKREISLYHIDRGGEVTLHSPGQLVVYPIFDLTRHGKDLKVFLRKLEEAAIDLLLDFDIVASVREDRRGIWVGQEKIVSIGIGVKKWVSFHGMAINVNTDLNLFSLIKPCGLDVSMASIESLKGYKTDMQRVKERAIHHFCKHFGIKRIV